MHLSNVRRKIAHIDATERISTLRGAGYLFLGAV